MSPEQVTGKIGKSVGEKLRAARVAQHYTQSQLAAPDFSVSYISAIERGQIHPSLRALEILAARLGLSSTQLLPTRSQQDAHMNATLDIAERDDDEVELALLEAELLIHQGNADQAANQINKISTKRLKRQQLLLHRYLLGRAYFATERFQEAEYTLAEALQIAKELNTTYLTLRILNISALAHAAMRNYTQALISHEHCINLLATTKPHDPFFAAQIYTYMGQHYTQLEYVDRAIEMFHKALAMAEEFATLEDAQAIYRDICSYYATTKEDDLAALHAYKSFYLSIQETNKHLRGELHHYLGHAIMKGDAQQARLYLDETLQQSGVLRDPLSLASVSARNAEWYANHEQFDQALKFALQAHELSEPFGDTIIAAEALTILGRIEYAISQYEQGDQHFTAGLEMFERLGSHQELANESVLYAQLLEERGKEREAFAHLRRAFQSRQRLGR